MLLPREPKTVVFDMDGLLIDTIPFYLRAMLAAGEKVGHPVKPAEVLSLAGLLGAQLESRISSLFGPEFPTDQFLETAMAGVHALLRHGAPLKPGGKELIGALRERRLPLAVGTSMKREEALHQLEFNGLADRFDVVVGRSDVANSKPHPDIYLEVAHRMGVAPADMLILEDSTNGVQAASAAGAMVIMVPDAVKPSDEDRARCTLIADDLFAVQGILREMGQASCVRRQGSSRPKADSEDCACMGPSCADCVEKVIVAVSVKS